jgi:hypothetical protein
MFTYIQQQHAVDVNSNAQLRYDAACITKTGENNEQCAQNDIHTKQRNGNAKFHSAIQEIPVFCGS